MHEVPLVVERTFYVNSRKDAEGVGGEKVLRGLASQQTVLEPSEGNNDSFCQ